MNQPIMGCLLSEGGDDGLMGGGGFSLIVKEKNWFCKKMAIHKRISVQRKPLGFTVTKNSIYSKIAPDDTINFFKLYTLMFWHCV